ncbi:Panacea domain-containing protein [Ornithinibacillus sp. 4-3]|uniref:Panacea domain-containing protein n=1 Tax=Ornithinibacillus sp. 4-3 TaxID=3231488 RepID=A0AB39HM76_9BACI
MRIAERNEQGYYELGDVVQWFLSQGSMSPKKLQKLLYYAHSWTLTLGNESVDELDKRLFKEGFEAWVHGPVIPSVYHEFKEYGFSNIPLNEKDVVQFDEEIENVLNQVWEVYGDYTGNELESMTHQELPWLTARKGLSPIEPSQNPISDTEIFNYYLNEMIQGSN